jgi:hypothetical protein
MREIARLIGSRTYNMLHRSYPLVFQEVEGVGNLGCKMEGEETDYKSLFIDSCYTPENLKEDFILIIRGGEPCNPEALRFVHSSQYVCHHKYTFLYFILTVLFWILVVVVVLNLILYYKKYRYSSVPR